MPRALGADERFAVIEVIRGTTRGGWRIRRRRYENVWVHGVGAGDAIPDPLKGARGPS